MSHAMSYIALYEAQTNLADAGSHLKDSWLEPSLFFPKWVFLLCTSTIASKYAHHKFPTSVWLFRI